MKVCVIQPYYSKKSDDIESCFRGMLELMDACDDSLDLIVLPEACDVPAAVADNALYAELRLKYNEIFDKKAKELAIRCGAMVFANYLYPSETGMRNTTYAINPRGEVVGKFFKAHPAPSEEKREMNGEKLIDCSYSHSYAEPYVLDYGGLRYAFLTCYDFYMYEMFPAIARMKPDIIIGCSHQRTDGHDWLETVGKFLCYNTNAWLVRASVSLGEESEVGGCSMVVSPDGRMVMNLKSRIGAGICDIEPSEKFYKSAGFFGEKKAHWEYIEDGRRPWLYRPGGSMMVADDSRMPYPRVCAHRGFSAALPENTLPAYGAAVALGADEIEFDIWSTKDGELVSCHDRRLDRTSDGTGLISDYTYAELLRLDFGRKKDQRFRGLQIATFEEILRKFSCTAIMNIHVKIWDNKDADPQYERIAGLIRKYGCERHCYMMSGNDGALAAFRKIAPDIHICMGAGKRKWEIVERAIKIGAEKVQLFKPYFNQAMIDKAKAHGILCNVFYADDPDEAETYVRMGVDTVLTNNYLEVANRIKGKKKA